MRPYAAVAYARRWSRETYSPLEARTPASIGPFVVQGTHAAGRCIALYGVRQRFSREESGLRVLQPAFTSNWRVVQQFMRECRVLARVRHPNVLAVGDISSDRGTIYAVTEPVLGWTLADLLHARGGVPVKTAVAVLRQLAGGLAAVHAAGQVHGALDPTTVLLRPDGRVTLLPHRGVRDDYGYPLVLSPDALAATDYQPPDQSLDAPPLPGADIYALGVLACELAPSGNLPAALTDLIWYCTAADPADRPTSAELDKGLASVG